MLTAEETQGIMQELRSNELSEEQEIALLLMIRDSALERHGLLDKRDIDAQVAPSN